MPARYAPRGKLGCSRRTTQEVTMTRSNIHVAAALALLTVSAPWARAADRLTLVPMTFEPASGDPVAAELGTLIVPEHRTGNSERMLALKFVRFRATSKPAGPPIVYLAGGPGGSGIDAAKGARFPLFMALRAFGDVIALDQRGTGASTPATDCTEHYVLAFDHALDRAEAERAFAAGMQQCFARLRADHIDPTAYTTLASADDLDDLRQALGADKLTLWSISYGTHLALATLRAHPERIERAILAGVEPLDRTLKLPSDQEALLDAIAALVRRDPVVGKTMPDLHGTIAHLLERLRDEPASVTLVHPATGQSVAVTVGPLDLQFVLAAMLTGPETFAGLPDFVWRLDHGDWTALALQAGRFRFGRLPSAMSVAMDCASGAGAPWLARIAAQARHTLLGDAINIPFPGICAGLGIPDLGDDYRHAFRSNVPVLLISGTLDGRTAPRNAAGVARSFEHAQTLLIEGAGHSDPLFLSSPQILEDIEAFLRGQRISAARIVLERPHFVPPRRVVEVADEVLSRYAGSYQIEGGDVRQVMHAGTLLYTVRGDGAPFPLRPVSTTDFFWEGTPGSVHFELAADGSVAGMSVDPDDTGRTWVRAAKID
jgi:pimeloyl-ACP methyl ester carboxylesterase